MDVGQQVRFRKDARNEEWTKGDLGTIDAVLARKPDATADIFLVKFMHNENIVWATDEDIKVSQGEQLTLF